jgi:hypothetical protein
LGFAGTGTNDLDPIRGGRVEPVDANPPAGQRSFQPHQSKQCLVAIISYHAMGYETSITLI